MLDTGSGFWSPLWWIAALGAAGLVVLIIRARGRSDYQKGTEQVKPFLSGQPEVEKQHVRASNVYWGFLEALKGYYRPLVQSHTGLINDYTTWFLGVLVLVGVLILGMGG